MILQSVFYCYLLLMVMYTIPILSRQYERCELARELYKMSNFTKDQVSILTCIAHKESNYNTDNVDDEKGTFGMFQIHKNWCYEHSGEALENVDKLCKVPCDAFTDYNLDDDVECVKNIHREFETSTGDGFNAFPLYKFCHVNLARTFIKGCTLSHMKVEKELKVRGSLMNATLDMESDALKSKTQDDSTNKTSSKVEANNKSASKVEVININNTTLYVNSTHCYERVDYNITSNYIKKPLYSTKKPESNSHVATEKSSVLENNSHSNLRTGNSEYNTTSLHGNFTSSPVHVADHTTSKNLRFSTSSLHSNSNHGTKYVIPNKKIHPDFKTEKIDLEALGMGKDESLVAYLMDDMLVFPNGSFVKVNNADDIKHYVGGNFQDETNSTAEDVTNTTVHRYTTKKVSSNEEWLENLMNNQTKTSK